MQIIGGIYARSDFKGQAVKPGRNLDYGERVSFGELGSAGIEDLLDRGDFDSWGPLAGEVRRDPGGEPAETILRLCDAHPMYGTSALWRAWIQGLRGDPGDLASLRRQRGLTQQALAGRMAISQSDISKLERRQDVRLSTLRSFVEATGGRMKILAVYGDQEIEVRFS